MELLYNPIPFQLEYALSCFLTDAIQSELEEVQMERACKLYPCFARRYK